MGKTYTWAGSTSDTFGVASNWIDQATGTISASVPGAQDTADFLGAGLVTGTGTLATLDMAATSSGFTFASASIGAGLIAVTGNLDLVYGTQLQAGTFTLGSSTAGGILQVQGSTLSGQTGSLNLVVSSSGQSTTLLEIGGQTGQVSAVNLGEGSAVFGGGSQQAGTLYMSNGTLAGGSASSVVFGQAGGFGSGTITNGGTLDVAGTLSIGAAGQGDLSIQGGGMLEAGSAGGTALVMGVANLSGMGAQAAAFLDSFGGNILLNGLAEIGVSAMAELSMNLGTLTTSGVVLGADPGGSGTLVLQNNTQWTDTGAVIVGAAGYGQLGLDGPMPNSQTDTIDGMLGVGIDTYGQGTVSIFADTLRVNGGVVLGAGLHSGGAILLGGGGVLDASGQTVLLSAGSGDTISVTGAGSALRAGALSIGIGSNVEFDAGTSGTLGGTGLAGLTIDGGLGVTGALSVAGGVQVVGTANGGSGAHGLEINGGTLSVTGTAGLAVTGYGQVNLSGTSSVLSVAGGIALTNGSVLSTGGGTLVATSPDGAAISVSSGATLNLYQGMLATSGVLLDAGSLQASQMQITSAAAAGRMAATIAGQGASAQLTDSVWTVTGGVDVGNTAGGELLLLRTRANLSGTLAITGGIVDAGDVLCGPGLALGAGQTGLSALAITLTGAHSVLEATSLQVGYGSGGGSLTIAGGDAAVSGDARLRGNVVLSLGGTLSAQGTVTVAAGTTLIGQGTLSASSIADLGRIGVSNGTLACLGPVSGAGLLSVRAGELVLGGTEAAGVGLVFGNAGTISVASVADLAGTFTGWQSNDAIDFTTAHVARDSLSGQVLSLFDGGGHLLGTLTFAGPIALHNVSLAPDHGGGTLLGYHG